MALVEGNSIRATCRMTGVAKGTVLRLLHDVGIACAQYQHQTLRNLTCRRVQCDEVWSFCYAKNKNVPDEHKGEFGYGDVWTWVALDADSKLVVCWFLGKRDADDAFTFIANLARRLNHKIQLTTDGHKSYLDAVQGVFKYDVDYAMLVKLYSSVTQEEQRRYSPAKCIGAEVAVIEGNPDSRHISTSYVERQNLTMRMSMRRLTRLTNAFSKKADNLACALGLHFMHYNFCRVHQTVKMTPAMAAGVADHPRDSGSRRSARIKLTHYLGDSEEFSKKFTKLGGAGPVQHDRTKIRGLTSQGRPYDSQSVSPRGAAIRFNRYIKQHFLALVADPFQPEIKPKGMIVQPTVARNDKRSSVNPTFHSDRHP